ncbi:6-phosphofructokinase [Extibacter muris]|uniref:6-phosphofructokinase n=1 Tax=Extibacter muris TaxID=1796622 RepID=UPI001D08A6B8|nr:6-phosphofructokinase [Extibacter muris]MCB6203612.1 6-phosphofructokinase [Extibacter muris]MCQ4665114.1 6-phosphofructokinase [Extibacter muris]MCQ4694478.1 6-phosphofructokinase [Extibacter muris]
MKKNIIVGQSGGPTAVINGSLYGVVAEGVKQTENVGQVLGMINGIEGFLQDRYMDIGALDATNELELVRTTPGAYLGSCRYKLSEDLANPVYPELFRKFEEKNIGYFFYIGGNDSMDTVSKLSRYAAGIGSDIRFIGVPKTIDNDLVETDHTPGYGSAAKYVATTVREIATDATVYDNKQSVTIVEIMGRHAGWLTAASMLARKFEGDNPVFIYLPEVAFDQDAFVEKVKEALKTTPNLVVCISEGINDGKGTFICEYASDVGTDTFGHKMLTGSGKYLENLVKERIGVKVRSVELNVCQRCSCAHLSRVDLDEAVNAGIYAVQVALGGETGKMITFIRNKSVPYELSYGTADVNIICNKEKPVPDEWIISEGSDISSKFIDYARPLTQGYVELPTKNGIPLFAYRK